MPRRARVRAAPRCSSSTPSPGRTRHSASCSKWWKIRAQREGTMSDSTKLLTEFPPVSTAEWEAMIRKDLKGVDYAKKLLWQTEEGITVKPYYRAEDLNGLEFLGTAPGEFPYTRGTKTTNEWSICAEEAKYTREGLI